MPQRPPVFSRLFNHISAPVGVLDLDALDRNADDLVRRANGTPIRLATKSLRIPDLYGYLLSREGFAGLFAYTLAEALYMHGKGFRDIVVGYPTADRAALAELAHDESAASGITLVVDSRDQLDLIDAVAPAAHRPELRVCIELDASYRLFGGAISLGPRRSPISSARQAAATAGEISRRAGFRLVGLLAYEGLIAGVPDDARTASGAARRFVQARSRTQIARRRAAAVAAVRRIAPLEFVNGGGTGSVESTALEKAVTEIAAGSGLLAPGLFDHFRAFAPTPAAYFGLDVVRRPAADVVTVLGGGWIASGPSGTDRLPVVAYPPGLRYTKEEQAGEVQTPLRGSGARHLQIGDRVWFRHAKAGEVSEHLDRFHLVRGDTDAGTWSTYRGEGQLFL